MATYTSLHSNLFKHAINLILCAPDFKFKLCNQQLYLNLSQCYIIFVDLSRVWGMAYLCAVHNAAKSDPS